MIDVKICQKKYIIMKKKKDKRISKKSIKRLIEFLIEKDKKIINKNDK